jgi:hypothetical protein
MARGAAGVRLDVLRVVLQGLRAISGSCLVGLQLHQRRCPVGIGLRRWVQPQ